MHVLLIHGLGRTPLSMRGLARAVERAGHTSELFGYVGAVESFASIKDRLHARLAHIAATTPDYGVVGHSLGGLLLRAALPGIVPRPAHMVMLGTPNRPPRMAVRARRFWPFRFATGEPGRRLSEQSFFDELPPLAVPYTIIAGTAGLRGRFSPFGASPNDWLVAVAETLLRDDDEPVLLPVGHSFMMRKSSVHDVVLRAFEGS